MCEFCQNHERGDTLYESSDWDGGIGFDYIRDIKYCPLCGRKLDSEDEPNNSEKPNNYEPKICDFCRYYNSNIPCGSTPSACKEADKFAEEFVDGLKKLKPKDEPTTEDCSTVDKDINVRSKDEPQTVFIHFKMRMEIERLFIEWCKENGIAKKPNSMVVFMIEKGWLNEEKINNDLSNNYEPQTSKGVSYSDHTDYNEPKNYVTWTEPTDRFEPIIKQTDCPWK